MATVTVAPGSGFCPGVKRAAELLERELESGSKVFCLGELIHNRPYNESLVARGVKIIDGTQIDSVPPDGVIFIRAHGETKEIYEKLASCGRRVVDGTCAYVRQIHRIAEENSRSGAECIILGDKDHPEVRGILSFAHGQTKVFGSAAEALKALENEEEPAKNRFFAAQTTFSVQDWKFFANNLKKLYTNANIFDTICNITETRQKAAYELASGADLVCVVGSPQSSNTAKLLTVCSRACPRTVAAETADDLQKYRGVIKQANRIVIIAGASAPGVIIQEVNKTMANIANEELSFEELLDQSFKTLTTGERVTGTILAVTPAEIKVDLGTKHTGILPYDEISADDNVDMSSFHVGDPIDVVCTKFSDVEGTVLLSKKRLDEARNAEKVAQAAAEGGILTGTV
ncbi:MAG: 4-hydroxy-3-methylbut-2-enyl diphosphate reductase [Clostridia bacterium]|nr:4-hydroxy-3-methylbut-2-enyl diphosphate reductase [Clostridia bacterium]